MTTTTPTTIDTIPLSADTIASLTGQRRSYVRACRRGRVQRLAARMARRHGVTITAATAAAERLCRTEWVAPSDRAPTAMECLRSLLRAESLPCDEGMSSGSIDRRYAGCGSWRTSVRLPDGSRRIGLCGSAAEAFRGALRDAMARV